MHGRRRDAERILRGMVVFGVNENAPVSLSGIIRLTLTHAFWATSTIHVCGDKSWIL